MKNYTITVNGTAYNVTVQEGANAPAPVSAPAPAAAPAHLLLPQLLHLLLPQLLHRQLRVQKVQLRLKLLCLVLSLMLRFQ